MSRAEGIGVAALTVLAALLRFATLDLQGFWYDEAVTVGLLDRGLLDVLREVPESESTPPLYYLLAWLWTQVFGTGEAGIRSLSALCGTATVPVAYAAARELCGPRAALGTAALVAVSPFLVWYSQEARSYALLTLLGALSLWLVARLVNRWGARELALWALVSALALATHYFAAFLLIPQMLWLFAAAPRRRSALAALAPVALAAASLAPLALHQRTLAHTSFIDDAPLPTRIVQGVKQLVLGFDSPFEGLTATVAAGLVAAGVVLALTRVDRRSRRGVRVAASIGAATFLLPCVIAFLGVDYLLSRNLIVAWVPVAIVVSAGLTGAGAGRFVPGLAILAGLALVSTIGVLREPSWQREDWRGAASAIDGPGPRAILVSEPNHENVLRLYIPRARTARAGPQPIAEIVAIARRERDSGQAILARPDPGALRRLGLREAERRREPTYELVRLVPVAGRAELTLAQLLTLRLARKGGPPAVLFVP